MRFVTCLLLFLLGTAAAQTSPVTNPEAANAQRARELLQKAVQALGAQAYLSIVDLRQEGRTYSFYHERPRGVGMLFWRFWKWPDKERVELTKQRDVIYIHNADNGYETTFRGTRPEEAKDLAEYLRRREYSLERVLRVWLNDPAAAFYYDGAAYAENKPAEQVTITTGNGLVQTLYLDKFNFLPIAKSFVYRDPETRERNEDLESYDNYHLVQGVNTPLTITRKRNGEMTTQRFITRVVFNSGLADSLFTPTVTYDPTKKP
jgi:hypothetical protein